MIDMQPIRDVAQYIPFLSLINVNSVDEGASRKMWQHPLVVRLAEAIIIGGLVVWVTVAKLEVRLEHVETVARDVQTDIKDLRREVFNLSRKSTP